MIFLNFQIIRKKVENLSSDRHIISWARDFGLPDRLKIPGFDSNRSSLWIRDLGQIPEFFQSEKIRISYIGRRLDNESLAYNIA